MVVEDLGETGLQVVTEVEGARSVGLSKATAVGPGGRRDPGGRGGGGKAETPGHGRRFGCREEGGQDVGLGPVEPEPVPGDREAVDGGVRHQTLTAAWRWS